MNELYRTIAAAALSIAVGFGWGWMVNGWRLDAKHEREARESAQTAARELADMTAKRDAKARELAAADDLHLKQLQGAQNETNRLRDCLRSGSCGLRIAAICPSVPQVPGTPTAASVDSGSRAELTAEAEQDYFALRDGLGRTESKLAACQEQLRLRVATVAP